ncbi:glycosyltransferase [Cellulomonas cellasea]|uniref:glycosyltransferase family 2 protein n=1 Tax=Cellulomonas cellasea TaxID=43670 RepID=UPI0025A427B7|nr:glycosyltransferase [Cellulomonas cellasea]MDM8083236.1 glycosyltransferase [Cellulomonas cellasea]
MRPLRPRRATAEPTVTVVVPCYNYGRYLPQVVASVLTQERVRADVVIVDDASTDDSLQVARALAEADKRVTVLAHEANRGHIATYNDGFALARGTYVVLLSADDLLAPGALARATDLMEAEPSVGLVYGLPESFSAPTPPRPGWRPISWTLWAGADWIAWASRRGRCFILSPEVVMRTAALREVGDYNPALPHSADLEYWLRTAARWDVGRVNGPVHAHYRVHEANMHLTVFATMLVDLRHRLAAFAVLDQPQTRALLPSAPVRWRRARRALAREALVLAARDLDAGADPATAAQLADFAEEAWPASAGWRRSRAVRRTLAHAVAGRGPTRAQGLMRLARDAADRIRWKVWRIVGIS